MEAKWRSSQPKTLGDAAVDGLFAGSIAGIAMLLTLVLLGLLMGEAPDSLLRRFATGQSPDPLRGGLIHWAVSGIYGGVFSLLIHALPARILIRLPGWLIGLLYSAGLLVLALTVILPGLRSSLQELPLGALAAGHAVYGMVLGWRIFAGIFSEVNRH